MKVWIDCSNSPHPLLFAPIAERLEREGAEILVTARDNAQTAELARMRWSDVVVIGGPSPPGRGPKMRSLAQRIVELARWARHSRPDVALSHNSYAQLVASSWLRIPSMTAMDYEFQPANHVAFRVANRILLPQVLPSDAVRRQGARESKVVRYQGLKEELYLGRFERDPGVLERVGIRRPEGVAVVVARTPPTGATYHQFGNPLFTEALQVLAGQDHVRCLVLPRGAEQVEEVERLGLPNCVVPRGVIDSRSLMCECDLFLGAGGTMTREAALLGVPTFSLFGGKRPAVDRWLEEQGALRPLESADQLTLVRPRERHATDLEALRARARAIEDAFVDATLALVSNRTGAR